MRALKVLVAVMGVLLVGGTAALVAAVLYRANHRIASPAVSFSSPVPRQGFDRAVVDLPEAAIVLGVDLAGDRLVVRIGLAHGGQELILMDPQTGARLGTIELRPSEAKP